ncbi:MAG: hypothetical protein AABZ55_10080, partial [Bdellovibrionota bacterium]
MMRTPFLLSGLFFKMRGLLLLALMGQLLMTSGCTRGGLNSPRTYKPGQFVFAFDLTEIIELSITKNDP